MSRQLEQILLARLDHTCVHVPAGRDNPLQDVLIESQLRDVRKELQGDRLRKSSVKESSISDEMFYL